MYALNALTPQKLPTVDVDCIVIFIDQFADGDKLIPAVFQGGKNQRQSLGGMQTVVVAKDNRAVFHPVDNPHGDFRRG